MKLVLVVALFLGVASGAFICSISYSSDNCSGPELSIHCVEEGVCIQAVEKGQIRVCNPPCRFVALGPNAGPEFGVGIYSYKSNAENACDGFFTSFTNRTSDFEDCYTVTDGSGPKTGRNVVRANETQPTDCPCTRCDTKKPCTWPDCFRCSKNSTTVCQSGHGCFTTGAEKCECSQL